MALKAERDNDLKSTGRKLLSYLGDISFLGPALVLYTAIVVIPFIIGAGLSFTDWDGLRKTMGFIGLQNYVEVLHDRVFFVAVKNTVVFAVVFTVGQNIAGILLAVAFQANNRIDRTLKATLFFPVLLSPLVVGFIWNYMYSPMYGVINSVLQHIGTGSYTADFLGNPKLSLLSIIVAYVWYSAPFAMVIYVAGLASIPMELYEASSIDGANSLQKFLHVTVPLVAPVTTVLVVFDMIVCLKIFDIVFVMTGGGPGYSTETIGVLIYRVAYRISRMGYSTTIGVVLFVSILAITIIQLAVLRRREVEY